MEPSVSIKLLSASRAASYPEVICWNGSVSIILIDLAKNEVRAYDASSWPKASHGCAQSGNGPPKVSAYKSEAQPWFDQVG